VLADVLADLTDLVLPAGCAGCGADGPLRRGACARCEARLLDLVPAPALPDPPPAGLPPVVALGAYEDPLRAALLAYKERGRHGLAAPLGGLLAEVVTAAVPAGPLVLVPVPSASRAARERHGDHLARLTRHTARRLRRAGRPVAVVRPLRAAPGPDSAGLSGAERALAAAHAFRVRHGRLTRLRAVADAGHVVLLDDIVTTGATLAAVTGVLAAGGIRVSAAAVLAATRRRSPPPDRGERPAKVYRTRGDG
jgi:predicted amidophosphoribosyltransferase